MRTVLLVSVLVLVACGESETIADRANAERAACDTQWGEADCAAVCASMPAESNAPVGYACRTGYIATFEGTPGACAPRRWVESRAVNDVDWYPCDRIEGRSAAFTDDSYLAAVKKANEPRDCVAGQWQGYTKCGQACTPRPAVATNPTTEDCFNNRIVLVNEIVGYCAPRIDLRISWEPCGIQ